MYRNTQGKADGELICTATHTDTDRQIDMCCDRKRETEHTFDMNSNSTSGNPITKLKQASGNRPPLWHVMQHQKTNMHGNSSRKQGGNHHYLNVSYLTQGKEIGRKQRYSVLHMPRRCNSLCPERVVVREQNAGCLIGGASSGAIQSPGDRPQGPRQALLCGNGLRNSLAAEYGAAAVP